MKINPLVNKKTNINENENAKIYGTKKITNKELF